ncbi:IS630 family transposase [Egibacter rhizosphaerae]|uniref:IS630 family transposase n=1 Tax=Egibacter rhizosphaerae TaxID=1670831 RepID=A0A411YC89_9ACTN|nr:IS630 family transposase [Egibacter rhizosphaerae]QBI18772.1 IS630 family transposase [Egibacter rhizosphaerae]
MANHAKVLDVSEEDRRVLQSRVAARTVSVRDRERAQIVLLAAEGLPAGELAARVGCSRPTVTLWRNRYAKRGLAGLDDAPRSGAPPRLTRQRTDEILAATLAPPPAHLGVTHWSSRLLARHLGDVSHTTITRLWKSWQLQPWRAETFKFSTDPELVAKVHDIVGLYLHPPENAVVLCVDEKSQIQALERTQPILPLKPGQAERQSHDYRRHGTTTLFAALEVATGKVAGACYPRHRHEEFLKFLKQAAKTYPRVPLHVIVDNYSAHKHADVKTWLAKNPRIQLHFTPTHSSWMNLVESFFSIITRQAIRRGSFTSVRQVTDAIATFIDGWNDRCQPFTWTKTADDILATANRKADSVTEH